MLTNTPVEHVEPASRLRTVATNRRIGEISRRPWRLYETTDSTSPLFAVFSATRLAGDRFAQANDNTRGHRVGTRRRADESEDENANARKVQFSGPVCCRVRADASEGRGRNHSRAWRC